VLAVSASNPDGGAYSAHPEPIAGGAGKIATKGSASLKRLKNTVIRDETFGRKPRNRTTKTLVINQKWKPNTVSGAQRQ